MVCGFEGGGGGGGQLLFWSGIVDIEKLLGVDGQWMRVVDEGRSTYAEYYQVTYCMYMYAFTTTTA